MVERHYAKREFEPERGGGQESGGLAVIVDVGDGGDGVGHLVVHDGVHADRHGVLRQDLKDWADGVGVVECDKVLRRSREQTIFGREWHVCRGLISDLGEESTPLSPRRARSRSTEKFSPLAHE